MRPLFLDNTYASSFVRQLKALTNDHSLVLEHVLVLARQWTCVRFV
jgi:hypothetical protein